MPKPARMFQCNCGSIETIETKIGVMLKNGKPSGGTKVLLCGACNRKGKYVVIW